jgi:hypothetical protein
MPLKYPLIPMNLFLNGPFMALVGVASVASVRCIRGISRDFRLTLVDVLLQLDSHLASDGHGVV